MYDPFTKSINVVHTGHIGDIIAFIPVFRIIKGTKLIIKDAPYMEPMSGFKYDTIKPLLESQGIEVAFNDNSHVVNYDMSGWRECYKDDISLTDAQARYANVVNRYNGHLEINEPWLKVDSDPNTSGRIIFNRTPRYRSPYFSWDKVYKHFGKKALFIGTENEYKEFCDLFGNIEYYKTESCLDVAKAIQGSEFFVGNQSSSFWIAAGLRKPLLQETCAVPNSIINYDGAHYTINCDADLSVI